VIIIGFAETMPVNIKIKTVNMIRFFLSVIKNFDIKAINRTSTAVKIIGPKSKVLYEESLKK